MTHFFLVLEGLDGSGKTALSSGITQMLEVLLGEQSVLRTYEPNNSSAAGEYIRDVLAKRIKISSRTLALAFALNRADHNERVITPFLDGDQRVIVCDRYYLSSLVYQSTDNLTIEAVMDLNHTARRPDLTLFLDASVETCSERMGSRKGDRELFEERLTETRQKYFMIMDYLRGRGEQIEIVDANGSPREVLNGVIDTLNRCAPDWLRLKRVEPE